MESVPSRRAFVMFMRRLVAVNATCAWFLFAGEPADGESATDSIGVCCVGLVPQVPFGSSRVLSRLFRPRVIALVVQEVVPHLWIECWFRVQNIGVLILLARCFLKLFSFTIVSGACQVGRTYSCQRLGVVSSSWTDIRLFSLQLFSLELCCGFLVL